jgi:hypothetical protein
LIRAIVVFYLFSLSGCASIGHVTEGRESKIEIIKEDNKKNEQKTFYSDRPSERYSGINYAHINDSTISLRLKSYGFFEEYSAPSYIEKKIVNYGGHGNKIVFFAGTILTAGLVIILNPKTWIENLVGWKEELSSEVMIKKELGQKTGNSIWKQTSETHDLSINFGGKTRVLHSVDSDYEHDFALKSDVLDINRASPANISISCLTCNLITAPAGLEKLYDRINFDINLLELKKKIEEEDKKELEARLKSAREQSKADSSSIIDDSQPLNKFKNQCNELGFKLGSKDFANCVMDLMGN